MSTHNGRPILNDITNRVNATTNGKQKSTHTLPPPPAQSPTSTSPSPTECKQAETPVVHYRGLARYQKLEKLGEGNYGCVYKARDKQTGTLVALKKIKIDDDDDGVPSTAIREVAILQDIVHEHIVRLEEVILENGQLYLVFEFLDLDLRRYLDNIYARPTDASQQAAAQAETRGLPMPLVKSYVYQILKGIEHMHSHRHLHRDLKPQNLLIDKKGRMQIADLGLARAMSTPMPPVTHEVATLWYRPPEVLLNAGPDAYSTPVDMWAIGCIMAEMISLIPSFPGDSEIDTLFKIFSCVGTPSEQSWPGVSRLPDWHCTFPQWSPPSDEKFLAKLHIHPGHGLDADGVDLLRSLLTNCPRDRISARQALAHPWFAKSRVGCMTHSAQARLDAQAARVAKAATVQAAARKAEKKRKAKEAKEAKQRERESEEYDSELEGEMLEEEEEFEEEEMEQITVEEVFDEEEDVVEMEDEQEEEEVDEEEEEMETCSSGNSASP